MGNTFGMFRCFFGTEINCIDPEYDTPTFDCLATTGPHNSKENFKHFVGERLPPRTSIQTYGHNKEIRVIQIDQSNEFRGALPRSSETPNTDYDSRTSICYHWGLPHPSEHHPWSSKRATRDHVPMRCNHWRCKQIRQHLQPIAVGLQSGIWTDQPHHADISHVECDKRNAHRRKMDYAMATSCTTKAIVRHHLYMKTGS